MKFKFHLLILLGLVVVASGCVSSGYNINTETEGEGSVVLEPSYAGYEEGTMVDFRAEPDEGWSFSHWEGDVRDIYTDNQEFGSEIRNDLTVRAVFNPLHELEIEEPEGEGTVSPKSGSHEYVEGEKIELEAEPEFGWKLSHWNGDVASSESDTTIQLDEDETVQPVFVKAFAGGSGTRTDPFQIENIEQLQHIQNYRIYHFVLTDDINASETKNWNPKNKFRTERLGNKNRLEYKTEYAPISEDSETVYIDGVPQDENRYTIDYEEGMIEFYSKPSTYEKDGIVPTGVQRVRGISITYETTKGKPQGFNPLFKESEFEASLNGQGHKISNLYINRYRDEKVGLFGETGKEAVIENFNLEDVNIRGQGNIGSIAGINHATISNIHVKGKIKGHSRVGGVSGKNGGRIHASSFEGSVSGTGIGIGGLTGENDAKLDSSSVYPSGVYPSEGLISESKFEGKVEGNIYVGGIAGSGNRIINSYSKGTVKGDETVGGLVGSGGANKSYTIAEVEANESQEYPKAGGLIGEESRDGTSLSFWSSEISGQQESAGGTEVSASKMKDITTYTKAGWDFAEIWEMEEYPQLQYQ